MFNGNPRKGEFVVKVDGFEVGSIVPASWGAEHVRAMVRIHGRDKVHVFDCKGREVPPHSTIFDLCK